MSQMVKLRLLGIVLKAKYKSVVAVPSYPNVTSNNVRGRGVQKWWLQNQRKYNETLGNYFYVVHPTAIMEKICILSAAKPNWESNKGYLRWKAAKLGENVSTILAYASPQKGRNQVSGRVSFPCLQTTPVANSHLNHLVFRQRSNSVSGS